MIKSLPTHTRNKLAILCIALPLVLGAGAENQANEKTKEHQTEIDEKHVQSMLKESFSGLQGGGLVIEIATGKTIAEIHNEVIMTKLTAPGSTIKPFVLLALLRSGRWSASRTFVCPRKLTIGSHKMDCSHPYLGHPLDSVTALAYSCNSFFAQAVSVLQPRELVQELQRSGLSALNGQSSKDVHGELRQPRNLTELQLLALGEEGIRVTPLILAHAYRQLALEMIAKPNDPALNTIRSGMQLAVEDGMATGAHVNGLNIAGKTGTATEAGGIMHGWFVGYMLTKEPRYLVLIYLEHGRGMDAAATANSVFKALARAPK